MKENDNNKKENSLPRPPVVAILGHIDHGKSTLLDYIRKTNTAENEAGGITQRISAYEVEVSVGDQIRKIVFLDTPGHEAFCSIRSQGAKVADIAVLVVSAEDGVKPQTIEALKCIKEDNTPFIVAISKIDKPGANLEKIKQDLAEHEILVEDWGGSIPVSAISAKTGQGVPELLELIALQADLEELRGYHGVPAEGFVIESDMDQKRGASATLIIKNGDLEIGMHIAAPGAFAPVRSIEDYKGGRVEKASFSSPIRIFGWNKLPPVGSSFKSFSKKDDALNFSIKMLENRSLEGIKTSSAEAFFEVVIKTDTFGSLEAVEHELKKLSTEKIEAKIISKGVGAITENDIRTANIKKGLVLGFNVTADRSAAALALRENVEVKTFNIIYELVDYVKQKLTENTPKETVEMITGSAKTLKTFSRNKDKQVIGGRVEEGEIKLGNTVQIHRRDSLVGTGKIKELQTQKLKASEVKEGQEFGLLIESKVEIVPGDILKAASLVQK